MTDLVKHDLQQLTISEERSAPANMLQAVMQAVRDPNVDPAKLDALLIIGERLEAKQAKTEFNRAMLAMQPELPKIAKNGTIIYKTGTKGTKFAKWDDIYKACMPLLTEHGFSVSFDSEHSGNALKVIVRIKHSAGHEESSSLTVPWLDTGGSKSPAQQAASSYTLAQRHAFCKAFNVLTEDQDDDGTGKGVPDRITEEHVMKIEDLVQEFTNRDQNFRRRFLARLKAEMQADAVADLFQGEQLETVMGWLTERKSR